MIGTVGEYIIENTNVATNIVGLIKTYEENLGLNTLPSNFIIKKIGIKPNNDCTVKINGREFVVNNGETLDFGYGVVDVFSLYISDGVKAVIRYLY